MDSEYILTDDGELLHWGIRGMKWGVRRYQNKDGSLTKAGKKRYNAETEKLKEREKTIKNQERTKAKFAKLDAKKAELDAREAALKNPNKAKTSTADDIPESKSATKQKKASDMNDKELQDKVNRLRNEEAYKDLSKKLGYDMPATEMDAKIADMERQKRYLELQRDIKNLTPEKVSRGKKFMNTVMNDVVAPAATKAGKDVLEKLLRDTGMDAVGKVIGDKAKQEAAKIAKQNEKAAKKEAKKEAKQEAKEAKKEAKRAAKEDDGSTGDSGVSRATLSSKNDRTANDANKSKVYEGTVEGTGNSSKSSSQGKKWTDNSKVIDAEYWDVVDSSSTSSGKSYVSSRLALPAPGLPAPKDDD